jgi:hypothetical protein
MPKKMRVAFYYSSRDVSVSYTNTRDQPFDKFSFPSSPVTVFSSILTFIVRCFRCYRPSLRATNPNAISSKSALLGSRALRLTGILTGGIFSFPGSSLLIFLTRVVLLPGILRFFGCAAGSWTGSEAGSSVSSKTTVARPPIPSPRRIEGFRFRGARLGAQDDIHVVSREGFCMFLVTGDKGA